MDYNKTIVITGTSTGIGKACALYLDKLGFKVYAGVRKQADGDNLKKKASDRLIPIILDVTDSESIAAAVSFLARRSRPRTSPGTRGPGAADSPPTRLWRSRWPRHRRYRPGDAGRLLDSQRRSP